MSDIKDDDIRNRAYALWEAAGRPDGSHDYHWHQAREELLNGTAIPESRIKVATSLKKPAAKKAAKADGTKATAKKAGAKDELAAPAPAKTRAKKASTDAAPGTS